MIADERDPERLAELAQRRLRTKIPELTEALTGRFREDLRGVDVIELDAATCEAAATIQEQSGVRLLDDLHRGAAQRLGVQVVITTADIRQASAAKALGFSVIGIPA